MKLNMKIIKWAGALLIALTAVGCAKDETKIQGNGISMRLGPQTKTS